MTEFTINVTEIETLQMIGDTSALEKLFTKAKSMVIGGGVVKLVRKGKSGKAEAFDELTTEQQLADYRKQVFKYL